MLKSWLAALLTLLPTTSHALLVTVEFEAVVTEVADDFGLLPGVELGSTVSGAYVYDDSVEPQPPRDLESRPPTVMPTATAHPFQLFRFDKFSVAGVRFKVGDHSFSLLNKVDPREPLWIFTRPGVYQLSWAQRRALLRRPFPSTSDPEFESVSENVVGLRLAGADFFDEALDIVPPPPDLAFVSEATFYFLARQFRPFCALCLSPSESRISAEIVALRIVPESSVLVMVGVAWAVVVMRRRGSACRSR